ncbi:MAG: hypothetical protein MJ219_01150 [Mycoplasmoidaceae bacterium]|nr:hypothetical protein [Mycoplasmoidaceae bacterium]
MPFRTIFNIPKETGKKDNKSKIMVDGDGNNGVMYAVDDTDSQIKINDIYKNFAKAKKDSELEDDKKPEALKHE